MNATQITALMARLAARLPKALADDENWDGDLAAVLRNLAQTSRHLDVGFEAIAEQAGNMEDDNWESAAYLASRAASYQCTVTKDLDEAAGHGQTAQDDTAAAIKAARSAHLSKAIDGEQRPSRFFAALAALDARPAA